MNTSSYRAIFDLLFNIFLRSSHTMIVESSDIMLVLNSNSNSVINYNIKNARLLT